MLKKTNYKNIPLSYEETGTGIPLVLLHGYLESLNIWDDFACRLSEHFRVVSVNLPGHGESGMLAETHTMDMMAEAVDHVLQTLDIEKSIVFGHSMGGYAALAYADLFPGKVAAYSLFHSSPKSDTEEKKENRRRIIDLINQGKKVQVVNGHVPNTFANDNVERFNEEIEWIKTLAIRTPDKGIIAALKGMMERPDRSGVIERNNVPVLHIIGKKDNFIPFEVAEKIAASSKNIRKAVLENSGHMGFLEEKEKALNVCTEFIHSIKF